MLAWLGAQASCLAAGTPAFFAGPIHSDNSGLRGYAMPVEAATWLDGGAWGYELGLDAANYWTYENRGSLGMIRQVFETQTLALGLRRGFALGLPMEARLQVALQQSNAGILNGFISGAESGMASAFGSNYFINDYRSGDFALKGNSDITRVGGHTRVRQADQGAYLGDTQLGLKAGLYQSGGASLSSRLLLNLPTAAERGNGAFAGLGLALAQPSPFSRLQLILDGRMVAPIGDDEMGLPMLPVSFGSTLGLEWNIGGWLGLPERLSLGLQWNDVQSPYQSTGMRAFDAAQNDLSFGLHHGISMGARLLTWQLWGREDFFFLPLQGRVLTGWLPYAPPDFQAGLSFSIQ